MFATDEESNEEEKGNNSNGMKLEWNKKIK